MEAACTADTEQFCSGDVRGRDNSGLGKELDFIFVKYLGVPLWSSGQSFWLQIQRSRIRDCQIFLSSSGSGTGSTQPREPPEVN